MSNDELLRNEVREFVRRCNEDKITVWDMKCFCCEKIEFVMEEDEEKICNECKFKDVKIIYEKKGVIRKELIDRWEDEEFSRVWDEMTVEDGGEFKDVIIY